MERIRSLRSSDAIDSSNSPTSRSSAGVKRTSCRRSRSTICCMRVTRSRRRSPRLRSPSSAQAAIEVAFGTTAQLMRSTIRCPSRSTKARFSACALGRGVAREVGAPGAERFGQRDRLAEVHEHAAEAPLQVLPRAHQPEHALLALAAALELVDHRALLDQPLVGDARSARRRGRAARSPGRRRRPTTSMPSRGASVLPVRERPPSMKNSCVTPVLTRYADVGAEHLLVERVVERAAQEERARAAEQEAERTEGHVLARRDVRRDQVVGVEQRGDDQEVEVGAVARAPAPAGAAWRSRPPSRSPTPRPRRRAGG